MKERRDCTQNDPVYQKLENIRRKLVQGESSNCSKRDLANLTSIIRNGQEKVYSRTMNENTYKTFLNFPEERIFSNPDEFMNL